MEKNMGGAPTGRQRPARSPEAGTTPFTYKGFGPNIFMNFSVGNDVFNMSTQRFVGPYKANQNSIGDIANRFMLVDPLTGEARVQVWRVWQN